MTGSGQISTTKRQRTRSKGAVCFEFTDEDDSEDRRVRVARDVDPTDAVTTSDPDAREYADRLPELALPGSGEREFDCGTEFHGLFCPDCGKPHSVGRTCRRSRCPRCWQSWAFHRGKSVAAKLEALGRQRYANGKKTKQHHLTVSFRDSTRFNSSDPIKQANEVQKVLLQRANVDTGYIIYHPFRIAPEYRGSVMGHESGEGDMTWKDVLGKLEDDGWTWEAVKDEFLTYAPHFHVLCLSEFVQTGAVVGEIEDETGIVIHRITTEREDGKERSIDGIEELCKVTGYCLSHAGLAPKNDGERFQAEVRPFGEVANFEAWDSVKANVDTAMRGVSGKVLGVDFSTSDCGEQVPDSDPTDHTAPDHAEADPSGSGTPSGSGISDSGGGSGTLASGGGSGFATALAEDADTGAWEATEGSVPPSITEPTPEETSTCGGDLAPIWDAQEYLGDLEWISQIEDTHGEERIHELREARREWDDLGKPTPESDPADTEDPPDE